MREIVMVQLALGSVGSNDELRLALKMCRYDAPHWMLERCLRRDGMLLMLMHGLF